jgi:two-component system, NtrC family, nitrogen regulation sensor histidine kinase NtrY
VNVRRRFIIYLVVVHAMLAALAWWLLQQNILWLVAIEIVFGASLAAGIAIVTRLSSSLSAVRQSAQMLHEGEFTTRFREIGHPDVDTLVRVYNEMVDGLREERVRLQEQQYFLGQLLAASPGGVIILDHEGRVASVNPSAARLLQLAAADVEGRPMAVVRSPLAEALARIHPGETSVVALSNGGRVRGQCATFVERGHARAFYLVEELTEELRQTEKSAYEKLIRMMSHEVNNTVGATRSLLESSLAYGEGLPAPRRTEFEEALGIAGDRLERLNGFMRGFADVVRMPPPVKRPADAGRLLEACVRLVQAQSDRARVVWRWEREGDLGSVDLDEAQMEQALINVLKNAVEALPAQGGTVTVRAVQGLASSYIEIEDTGPGIPDEARPHLFTPFFTTKQNGQGIGLTMVQEILRRHGFSYALDGPPGGPTRFRIEWEPASASGEAAGPGSRS